MANGAEDPREHQLLLAQTDWLGRLAAELVPAADRDDLIQDILLSAMRRAEHPTHLRGWLATVARNLVARRRRRDENRRGRERSVARDEASVPSAADSVASFASHRAVVNAVMELDEPYRTAVLLRFWEDLPPRVIAERTGAPSETVRTRIRRGLERLRAKLDGESGGRMAWAAPLMQIGAVREAVVGATPTAGFAAMFAGVMTMKFAAIAGAAAVVVLALVSTIEFGQEPMRSERVVTGGSASEVVAADEPSGPARVVAPVDRTPGSLLVRVRYADAPAAGVGMHVRGAGPLGEYRATGADGTAELDGLAPGTYRVRLDRGGERSVIVRPSSRTECEIAIDEGVLVRGRVVTLEGQRVADARVYALDASHPDGMLLLARADAHGEFEIRDVTPGIELHARADGWQPSGPRDAEEVDGQPGDRVEVELRLGARGHALYGRIIDQGGRVVPHALVGIAVDEDCRRSIEGLAEVREDADGMLDRETFLVRADENGAFETTEVPWGDVAVLACGVGADAQLVGAARVDVRRGVANHVTVVVARGAAVFGTVRDERGEPYGGVRLRAEVREIDGVGELARGFGGEVADRFTETAADGSYRMDGLAAAEVRVRRVVGQDDYDVGRTTVRAGEERRLDLTVERTWEMRVRVQDPTGAAMEGWIALLTEDGSYSPRQVESAKTNADGVRIATGLRDDRYVLSVHPPEPDDGGVVRRFPAFLQSVERGATEVVATVTPPTSTVRGRVVDPAGRPVSGVMEWQITGFGERVRTRFEPDGRFEIDRLPAGGYRLEVDARDHPPTTIEVDVPEATEVDLGDVRVPPAAVLEVAVRAEDGGTVDEPRVWVERDGEYVGHLQRTDGGEWRKGALHGGEYAVHVSSENAAPAWRMVRLAAGESTRVVVHCARGVTQEFDVEVASAVNDRARPVRGMLEVRDQQGRRLVGRAVEGVVEPGSRRIERVTMRIVPGRYEVVTRRIDGEEWRANHVVPTGGAAIRAVVR